MKLLILRHAVYEELEDDDADDDTGDDYGMRIIVVAVIMVMTVWCG